MYKRNSIHKLAIVLAFATCCLPWVATALTRVFTVSHAMHGTYFIIQNNTYRAAYKPCFHIRPEDQVVFLQENSVVKYLMDLRTHHYCAVYHIRAPMDNFLKDYYYDSLWTNP